jgi:hypothetical protein
MGNGKLWLGTIKSYQTLGNKKLNYLKSNLHILFKSIQIQIAFLSSAWLHK